MVDARIQTALIDALDHLPLPSQQVVLDVAQRLARAAQPTPGTPFEKVKHLAGTLPAGVADSVEKATEDCEQIDVNEW
jgi:hypothetical protein